VKCNRTIHEEPETIRGMFALTDTRNCTHGSGRLSLLLVDQIFGAISAQCWEPLTGYSIRVKTKLHEM